MVACALGNELVISKTFALMGRLLPVKYLVPVTARKLSKGESVDIRSSLLLCLKISIVIRIAISIVRTYLSPISLIIKAQLSIYSKFVLKICSLILLSKFVRYFVLIKIEVRQNPIIERIFSVISVFRIFIVFFSLKKLYKFEKFC